MSTISLKLRLLVAWAVFIALTLQVAGIGLRVLFERSITRRTQTELEADLRQLRRGMEVDGSGVIRIAREPTDPQFDIVFGGRYWQIQENGTTLLRSRSLSEASLDVPQNMVLGDSSVQIWLEGPEAQRLYSVVRDHTVPATDKAPRRTLRITTAVDAIEIEEDTNKFSNDLFSSLFGLALLLLLGAWAHVTIGLRPLEALRSKVAAVREGKARRLDGDYPEEVMPLVSETNALLEAQEQALRRARERAGDLAHGLKTPLAIMSANARTLQRKGDDEIAGEIEKQVEAMRRHVERELALARARGSQPAGRAAIDVAPLIEQIAAAIRSLPRGEAFDWRIDLSPPIDIKVDADDFHNILGNLVDNAHKWARNEIRIKAFRDGGWARFIVEDDGPGVPDEEIERVLQRGERADTSVGGTGLGLAIVNDLVELYGGKLQLARSALGGLKATVSLPA